MRRLAEILQAKLNQHCRDHPLKTQARTKSIGFGLRCLNLAVRVLTMSCGVIHFRIMPWHSRSCDLTSCCVHHLEPTKDEIRKKWGSVSPPRGPTQAKASCFKARGVLVVRAAGDRGWRVRSDCDIFAFIGGVSPRSPSNKRCQKKKISIHHCDARCRRSRHCTNVGGRVSQNSGQLQHGRERAAPGDGGGWGVGWGGGGEATRETVRQYEYIGLPPANSRVEAHCVFTRELGAGLGAGRWELRESARDQYMMMMYSPIFIKSEI